MPASYAFKLESRSAVQYLGGHEADTDYVAWSPTHPELFCSSSQRDKRIVFWDTRREHYHTVYLNSSEDLRQIESRPVQIYTHSIAPAQLNYGPDGKTLSVVAVNYQLAFMTYGQADASKKPEWSLIKRDTVRREFALRQLVIHIHRRRLRSPLRLPYSITSATGSF